MMKNNLSRNKNGKDKVGKKMMSGMEKADFFFLLLLMKHIVRD